MRICKCGKEHNNNHFYCTECRKKYDRVRYQENKVEIAKRKKEIKEERYDWFTDLKSSLSCQKCGESHPAIIEFHHREGEEKIGNISDMMGGGFSLKKVEEEIKKCDILCSNCHRKIHWEYWKKKYNRTIQTFTAKEVDLTTKKGN